MNLELHDPSAVNRRPGPILLIGEAENEVPAYSYGAVKGGQGELYGPCRGRRSLEPQTLRSGY